MHLFQHFSKALFALGLPGMHYNVLIISKFATS